MKTTTRSYRGSLPNATTKYQRDAVTMAQTGWTPTSQTYAAGSWGCGYFLIALLLCLVVVGIVILIAMLIVKPEGTLVVTYEFRPTEGQVLTELPVTGPIGDGWR